MNKLSVLVIDDETANLKVLSSLLKDDYQVRVAKSGELGIQSARDVQPDLIILDIIMPEMDGFEVLAQLQQHDATCNIPVIFITGLNSAENEERGLSLGAVDYIHKPFSPAVVKARVATHIKLIKQNQALTALSQQLKQASIAKGQFLANMSHEIRTPLTTIIGYADGILQGYVQKEARFDAVETISNSGKHLLMLINDILDFSKIEAGQMDIELIEFNLPELLQLVYQMSMELVKQKSLQLEFVIEQAIPSHIISDPTRLKQILLNLLSNAIKFTERGGVKLNIKSVDEQLIFSVSDTGIGIAEDKISGLFSAFTQAENSTSRRFGGSGLGLSISRDLTHRLGGDLTAQSRLGKGSCFTASIALTAGEQSQLITDFECVSGTVGNGNAVCERVAGLQGHVLLAEDHEQNRKLFCMILESLGLTVDAVANGKLAVEAALTEDYQLILMDIQMPVLDGLQAFEMLQGTGCDTPVIALTANVIAQDVERYLALGFADHCAKPINKAELIKKVQKFISGTAAESDSLAETVDTAALAEIKRQFQSSFIDYVDQLERAHDNADLIKIGQLAHKLRGSAASFEFHAIGKCASDVETMVKKQDQAYQNKLAELIYLLASSA